ncbi:hypothetical protein FNV43_RR19182 [Rhamnella rubrinervis]|uniref:Uncharacterized protein n=1 Tax=Rhamnella rubrinervis TaxID=2594499 RepID=A0A8K0E629_9ROSA|nr:hypothetical protein FNV43_RR19182 [Rhamnella rubrinervis]
MEVIDLTESPPPSPNFHGKSNKILPKSLELALILNSAGNEPDPEPQESNPMVLQEATGLTQNHECEMSDLKLLENMQLEGTVDQPVKNRKKYTFFYARGRLSKDHWTEREHELFLMGLVRYGKGHWTKIARHFVGTKTPQQVSTYALAFFKRLPITYLYAFKRKRPSLDFTNPTELFPVTTTTTAASDQTETPPAAASIHGQTTQQPDYELPQTLILFPVEAPLFPVAEPNAAGATNAGYSASLPFGVVDDRSDPMEEWTLGLPAFATHSMDTSDELDLELRLG